MTEIAVRQDTPPAAPADAAEKLIAWAKAAQAAHSIAVSLVKTSFVPKNYAGKPEEATAAILAGAELGFDPMASLRTFDNIQGTTAPKAITLRAVAQSHGHELDIVEEDERHAVARYRRRGAADYQFVEWTIERAERMGLPGKNPNWKTNPQSMLVARVTAEAARRVASDAILGIPYSSEELTDHPENRPAIEAPSRRVTAAEITAKADPPTPPPTPHPVDSGGDDGWPETLQIPGADQ